MSISHIVTHRNVQICLRNAKQMGPPVSTIASDFAYIASLDLVEGLQVNSKYMWTKINKQ